MVDFKALTVLVVDDETYSVSLLTRVLQTLEIGEVLTAENGVQAIEVLQTGPQTIDLIICDIEMPEMDGFELARKIRYGVVEAYRHVPFLMLTGHDTPENIQKGRIHKIDGFIVKPPTAEDLRLRILSAMGA